LVLERKRPPIGWRRWTEAYTRSNFAATSLRRKTALTALWQVARDFSLATVSAGENHAGARRGVVE
jgi:hypothetical protein